MPYASLFLVPVPTQKLDKYREIANKWNAVFREYGGIDHREWVLERAATQGGVPPIPSAAREGETLVFSVVECKDKADYDRIMKSLEQDPRVEDMMNDPPFDMERTQVSEFSLLAGARVEATPAR